MKYTKQDKILINAFVQAQKDIEHFYLQALREKNLQKAKYYAEKAKLVVQELQEEYQDWALTRWAEEYLKGFKQVEHLKRGTPKREQKLETNKIFLQVGKVHKEAVLALVQSGNRAVFSTLDGMKRDITYWLALFSSKGKEIWLQHEIQSKLGAGLLTGKSLHYQKSDLVAFFQKKGLQLRDKSGRKRDPHTYAEMLIRTETARAYNTGMINRALELWTSKFMIEESWNCCSICAQYNGKVVDISKGGYDLPPYHPNCKGTIVPVWEEDWRDTTMPSEEVANQMLYELWAVNKKYWGAESPIGTVNEAVLRHYTTNDGYDPLNKNLREWIALSKKDHFVAETLDKIIANNTNYKLPTYRWIMLDYSKLKNIIDSGEIIDEWFISTTKDPNIARRFFKWIKEKVMLEVHHQWWFDIEKFSHYWELEKEVLLWRNKKFKILEVENKWWFTLLKVQENG